MVPKRAILYPLLAALASLSNVASADLPLDQITVAKLSEPHPYRLYLTDPVINHLPDGKLTLIDGRTLKVEGMVSTGMFGQTALSPDRSEIYVLTTYYAKLNRGQRIEEIDVYDAKTLALKEEIPYPARHTQALPYGPALRTTADGRFILVQNATPATSVSIVNRKTGQQVTEVATPGCYMLYPAQSANRFATLCGDGTMLTISLDDEGKPVDKKRSAKFFEAESDPLFVAAPQEGDRYHFVTFHGQAVTIDVGGEVAKPGAFWSLLSAKDKTGGWRPGGYQPLAYHQDSDTLYVAMHPKSYEGSHKNPAHEIWVYDLKSQSRVARSRTPEATGLAVSQGNAPRLFAYNSEKASIAAFDGGRKLKLVRQAANFGDMPTQLQVQ